MSTDSNSVAGKVRNAGVNTWLVLLAVWLVTAVVVGSAAMIYSQPMTGAPSA